MIFKEKSPRGAMILRSQGGGGWQRVGGPCFLFPEEGGGGNDMGDGFEETTTV